jgi:hypothetical protein
MSERLNLPHQCSVDLVVVPGLPPGVLPQSMASAAPRESSDDRYG